MINSNLAPILHQFRDIAFDRVQNWYIGLPLLYFTRPTEGFPLGTISVKFYLDVDR